MQCTTISKCIITLQLGSNVTGEGGHPGDTAVPGTGPAVPRALAHLLWTTQTPHGLQQRRIIIMYGSCFVLQCSAICENGETGSTQPRTILSHVFWKLFARYVRMNCDLVAMMMQL